MTDHQVFIFGSFTDDEVKSLQLKPPRNDLRLTFGSFDLKTLRSVGIFDSTPTERLSSRKNVFGDVFQPPVASSESKIRVERDLSVSSGSSIEYSGPPSEGELCFGSNGFVFRGCENGNHQRETKESIFTVPNGKIATFRNFVPRGLVNLGNLCFLNATLQALVSCSPFLELLHKLRNHDIPQIGYPTLHAFVEFISNFDVPTESSSKKKGKINLETGLPFRPVMFDSILKIFTPDIPDNLSGRPRQEDAQEFLSFVMHQMHDELLKIDGQILNGNGKTTSLVSSTDDEDENDEWETVGPMNKTAITRTQSFVPSKLSAIFGGQLKSVVEARGIKASATIQPFLLLHLNICPDPVCTIEDALELFSSPETLEGYRISTGGKAEVVTASKSVKILELPEILVLHLMRFSYGSQGSTKLHKDVCFPLELVIGCELLVSPSPKCRTYELVATITHHGKDPWKGHYTADALHPNGKWLRYDDASVMPITESKVLHDQAYVLFYRRL